MSVTPLSDRKAMVNYAIDLLRAHQIRRENVFLHEQLKTCAKELATLRDEVRDLRANQLATVEKEIEPMKVSIDINAKKAFVLMDRHDSQLNEQARELETIRQSHRAMQTETSNIRDSCRKTQEDECAQRATMEKQLEAVRAECENLATAQQQQARRTLASLETLRSGLDSKADVAVIEMLETRVNEFSTRQNAAALVADSVSHISDTLERRCHPLEQAGKSVQVQDSQRGNYEGPEPRETTVPDDLDLDANAHTISYAGHCYSEPGQNDSLKMLSPPTVQATQLAEIKTLRQRRFDGWDSYYNQGQKIVEALPRQFEGTIVHNFVNGLFKESHRKQCQQWLDSSGWTWANVTTFGNLCSQLFANNATKAGMDTETLVHPGGIGVVLAAVSKSGRDAGAANCKKSSKGKCRQVTVDVPLRRSQRVADKQGLNTGHAGRQPEPKSIQGSFAHGVEQHKAQESKPENQVGNECSKTQNRPQSDNATDRRAGMRESETAGVKLPEMVGRARPRKGTAVATETRKSHKRKPVGVEVRDYSKRLKSRSKAGDGDDHAISIPQLVPFRGGIVKSVEESSNDEGFLYDGNLSQPSVPMTAGQPRGHRKRRLPLPPPPEIPILPTTDEE